ncbi:MAG: acetyltransferase [Frankiales bacterium]|nr:acetyltransferase [Frankiales bacterium]
MGLAEWSGARRERRHVDRVLATATRIGIDPVVLGDPVVDAPDLEIGDNFKIWSAHRQTLVSGPGRIRIGNGVFINAGSIVYSELAITIGDDVALANEVYVMDTPSHGMEGRDPQPAAVTIGRGTWVGARAIVLPGVTIGSRVVVAAGSVVTRDVPDEVLVGGNPARVIRPLTYPPLCRRAWHDVYCWCPGSLLGPPL